MRVRLVYFAWVRETIGKSEETIDLPGPVTVRGLIAALRARGAEYEAALEHEDVVRAAIGHEHAEADDLIGDGDEVALFPPMTGG